MDIRTIDRDFAVAPQLRPADLDQLARSGIRAVICNRPDGESADQPGFAEIEHAARALGMEARYLPAESGKVTDEQGAQFGELLAGLPKPALAYCRTGMRSVTLWALSQATQRPLHEILQRATAAGFDLKGVQHRIVAQPERTG
jgi:sulfide:quinone oxidoreductase